MGLMWMVPLLLVMAASETLSAGAPECPCVSPSSPLIQQAAEQFAALGAPGYGLGGECRAYDQGLAFTGCEGLDATVEAECKEKGATGSKCYCFEKWCYVDSTLCPINKDLCTAAGGAVGTDISPYCRDREMTSTELIKTRTGNTTATAYYSYATCGSLNTYDTSRLTEIVAGRNLKVKITDSYYWTFQGEVDGRSPQWAGWTGVLNSALEHSFRTHFDPDVNVTLDESWSSQTSRSKYSSSWTACVLDVAVGNADMCIGDFWVTPQRMNLANFLTPFDNDNFYLVAPRASTEEPLFDILQKPFLPFSNMLWVVTFFFLIFSAIVMMVTDGHNIDDYNNQGKVPIIFKSLYFAFAGYVQGGSANYPASVPGRTATLGFGFFVLITLASYTANLATILVTRGSSTGITGAQDAIDKGVQICIGLVVEEQLRKIFPSAKFVPMVGTGDIPRAIGTGLCGAAILQETAIDGMHAGRYSKADCKAVDDGDMTEAEAYCVRDEDGEPRTDRDCCLARAGELIMSVPLSVPIRTDLVQSLSWAIRKTLQEGKIDEYKATFEQTLPPPACGEDGSLEEAAKNPLESLRLPANSMLGTTIISILVMVFALLLSFVEIYTGKTIQELVGCANPTDPLLVRTESGGVPKSRRGHRRAIAPSGSQRNLVAGAGAAGGVDNRTLKLHTMKLNEMHRMLAKLCGEEMQIIEDFDSPRKGTKVMPLGSPLPVYSAVSAWPTGDEADKADKP